MQKRNKLIRVSTLIVLISLTLDLVSKYIVHLNMHYLQTISVIDNFFNLVYVRNTGSAFSFLSTAPDWFRKPFFIIVPLCAMILILFLMRNALRKGKENPLQVYAFSLIISGALGNFINRIFMGSVIDFLQFKITRTYYWPSFNVADIAITIGVALLFIEMIQVEHKERKLKRKTLNKKEKSKKQ